MYTIGDCVMTKKSVFGFVLGWAAGHKGETERAEATMHATGERLGHAFASGVMDGVVRAREEALCDAPLAAIEAPSNAPASPNGKSAAKSTRRRSTKKR
jgi:hypothetical protein